MKIRVNSVFHGFVCFCISSLLSIQSLQAQSCQGQRELRAQPKIVGGNKAQLKHWPAQAILRLNNPIKNQTYYFCGGTAISPNWILTAAHCLVGLDKPDNRGSYWIFLDRYHLDDIDFRGKANFQVVLGTDNLKGVAEDNIYGIEKVIIHQDYATTKPANDIALVKLVRPWNGPVTKLSPTRREDPVNVKAWVGGFGDNKYLANIRKFRDRLGDDFAAGSDNLLEVRVPIIQNEQCSKRYPNNNIGPGQICAGYEAAGRDSCKGDSGGPLIVYNKDRCPYQVGIVSWGDECAKAKSYGVYSRVSYFATWIQQHVPDAQFLKPDGIYRSEEAFSAIASANEALGQLQEQFTQVRDGVAVKIRLQEGGYAAKDNKVVLTQKYFFEITSRIGGQLILIDINAAGHVMQIFPNKYLKLDQMLRIEPKDVIRLPDKGYGFDWFRAVEPAGKGKLLALIVPDDFPMTPLLTHPERIAKGFAAEKAPTNYLMNLLDQIDQLSRQHDSTLESTAKWKIWSYTILDYEIVE